MSESQPPQSTGEALSAQAETQLAERLKRLDQDCIENTDFERLYQGMKSSCSSYDATLSGRLQSQPTLLRRISACIAIAILIALALLVFPPATASADVGFRYIVSGIYAILIVITLYVGLRPIHLPPLARWKTISLVCIAVGATVVAALLPFGHAELTQAPPLMEASPCLGFGLLLGLPVYALARILDRGNTLGNLLAAAAAGLAGNLVLQIHCPANDAGHMFFGHASVAVVFVGGLALLTWLFPKKT